MISFKELKSKTIRASGRSSDYIFPTLVQGCVGHCMYCYAARHSDKFQGNLLISNNVDDIIKTVRDFEPNIVKPNQTHEQYITWDIGCNSDVSIDINHTDWHKVFDYFKASERDFATFATKFVNTKLLTYNAERKIRVRLSLMPPRVSNVLEPSTSSIRNRIEFINDLHRSGYEVHLNFSPVIYYEGWIEDYTKMFKFIDKTVSSEVKDQLACEIIFLTHSEALHNRNIANNFEYENLLWCPDLQEEKTSQFGGSNIRYKHKLKYDLISEFKGCLAKELPYCNIRYSF